MNEIENAINLFLSHWYDSSNDDGSVYTVNRKIYQIIQPSELLDTRWYHRDSYYDYDALTEEFDLIGEPQYSASYMIDRIVNDPYYGLNNISEFIKKGYFIKSIIELSDIVPVNELHYLMIEYSKRKPKKTRICNYKGSIEYTKEFDLDECMDEWDPILVDDDYKLYLNQVNDWIFCDSKKPSNGEKTSYYYCSYENLPYFFEHLRPELLKEEFLSSRKQLQLYKRNGKTKLLMDMASIIYPKFISNDRSYYINHLWVYAVPPRWLGKDIINSSEIIEPIEPGDYKTVYTRDVRTDTRLHKGDYYMPVSQVTTWVPILEEPAIPIYAQEGSSVIRFNDNINLEYLYLYFETDVGRMAINILSTKNAFTCLPKENIDYIQIVLPQRDLPYYIDVLSTLYFSEDSAINSSYTYRQQEEIFDLSIDDDLIQMKYFQLANFGRNTNVRRIVLQDIAEVNKCIKAGAFKAAVILCGSVLEAILLDWVSEIDGVNYFDQRGYNNRIKAGYYGDEKRYFYDKDGKISNPTFENLIDRIDDLEPPVWYHNEQGIATIIRKERNNVHAGLAILNPTITEDKAKLVLEYLKTVLLTRGLIVN